VNYPKMRTPHGPLAAVHNGRTLAYLTRLNRVADAAREVAVERGLLLDGDGLEPLTAAEKSLAQALLDLGSAPGGDA
jgi:hypothetical protein